MTYIPLILAVLGVVLILAGIFVSIADWNRQHRDRTGKDKVVTEGTSASEMISALAKLAEALKDLTLGMQLIFAGIAVEIIAAFFGGIALLGK